MSLDPRLSALLACPVCHARLQEESNMLLCASCGRHYVIDSGIPVFLVKLPAGKEVDYITHYVRDSEVFDYFETQRGATEHSERRIREYTLSLVPKETQSILDVGCGSAWVAKALQRSGRFLCSLDISTQNHVGIAVDSYHLPFQDNSFDTIIAAEIIEHLNNPEVFVAELLRVIKPSGAIIISTPYKEKLVYELCIHCHELTPHHAHLHSWNEETLHALFGNALREWTFYAFNNKLLVFARLYPFLAWMPFAWWRSVDRLADLLFTHPMNCVFRVRK